MMLDKLREGAQGKVAKVILGLIILSFALAGVGSYLNGPARTAPATVNGNDISAPHWRMPTAMSGPVWNPKWVRPSTSWPPIPIT